MVLNPYIRKARAAMAVTLRMTFASMVVADSPSGLRVAGIALEANLLS